MILYLKEADVRRFLTMHDAIGLVEDAARALGQGHANNCQRQRPHTDSTMMHVLPAAYGGADAMGLKVYTAGKRGTAFYYMLFNAEGLLLALIEANWLGAMRTGAASAVATRYMSRENSTTLGIIGTGHQARTQLEAVMHVRNFTRIRAWSRTAARLDPFVADMSEKLSKTIEPAASAEECVAGADVVVTMTTSTEPVLKGAWISAGTHLNVAGSNHIHRREVDGEAVQRSGIVAVEDLAQAKVEAGDLKIASDEKMFHWDRTVLLSDIVAGKSPGRHDPHEITMFKSIGIGLWDVVAARHVYDRARAEHAGVELAVEEPLRQRSAR